MDKKNTPEVKLGQYKGLAVTRHVRPVTDKTVDIELVHQARMHAVYHPTTEPQSRRRRWNMTFRYISPCRCERAKMPQRRWRPCAS